jgi:hypothetical protein
MGGICVIIKEGLPLFRQVKLELMLKDGRLPIKCTGSVVWVVKKSDPQNDLVVQYDTGIEFTEISEADQKRIGNIVEKILPSS